MPTRIGVRDGEPEAVTPPSVPDMPAVAEAVTNCRKPLCRIRNQYLASGSGCSHWAARSTSRHAYAVICAANHIEWIMQYDLLSRLKTETAECHTRLENALDLMRPEWPREDYVALLEGFYGYVAPWEDAAAEFMPAALRDFFEERRKASLLASDLALLTGDNDRASRVTRIEHLSPMNSIGRLFGSMYVMEGSTLGGRFIAPHVATLFDLRSGCGNAYFEAYGSRTGSMWKAFRETASASVPPEQYDAAVDAAVATFDGLHGWLGTVPTGLGATA
jgi:heme oxygenase (biliverdin-IX-beta and delta-forming)